MEITTKDIQKTTEGKEYLTIKYANGNLRLLKELTEKLGYGEDVGKTLQLGLLSIKELVENNSVQLNKKHGEN